MSASCTVCGTTKEQRDRQWWNLRNYYGWSGRFCPNCYDKVSHNSHGNPVNPQEYTLMLLKRNG